MLVVRRATPDDIDALLTLSEQTGHGMTTMPTDRNVWESRLAANASSFKHPMGSKQPQTYFFVLEDVNERKLVGTTALYNNVGLDRPFYSYKVSKVTTSSSEIDVTLHQRVLHLVNDYTGCTEIGSLFLLPEYRKNGIGQFLSRSRFMLLADFPERFAELVFAELRGWVDEEGNSPFWQFLGSKFFDLSYEKADFISAVHGSQFISDLMPKYPIYVNLLPQSAQEVIGKPNDGAAPAMRILQRENFQRSDYIDIFDAGPCLQCPVPQIHSVRNSVVARIKSISDSAKLSSEQRDDQFIVSNGKLTDYRMTLQPIEVDGDQVVINRSTAEHLHLDIGDSVRHIKLIER
jgi:arginine N-succinyltransferase